MVQLELQPVGEGHLEPKMPPVSQRITCSRRKERLSGWGWMAGMGGQQGSTPHQRLSTQFCRSVVIAGCTCKPTSQERVRVWRGCRVTDRSHRLRSGRLAGGNVDTPRSTRGCFSACGHAFEANRRGEMSYLWCGRISQLKHPPVSFPGPQSCPLGRSADHQGTFIREPTAHKARRVMLKTACTRGVRESSRCPPANSA